MTNDRKIYRAAHLLACVIIGLVLLSGFHKLLNPADFALAIYRFHLLPGFMVNAAAIYLPWLEIVCALCLLTIPKYRVAALWIVLAMLAIFTVAIAVNLWRGSAFGCGCFGSSSMESPMGWLNIARNLGLLALILLALLSFKRSR